MNGISYPIMKLSFPLSSSSVPVALATPGVGMPLKLSATLQVKPLLSENKVPDGCRVGLVTPNKLDKTWTKVYREQSKQACSLDQPDGPASRVHVVDVSHVVVLSCKVKSVVHGNFDTLHIVGGEQGTVWPLCSELQDKKHRLAEPLVRPLVCGRLSKTCGG